MGNFGRQTEIWFRFFLIIAVTLEIVEVVISVAFDDFLPPVLRDAYKAYKSCSQSSQSIIGLVVAISTIGLFIMGIVATIGLVFFKRWSRPLAVGQTVASSVIYPLVGPVVFSGWMVMLSQAVEILWGGALAMAYFSELREKFK